MPRQETLTLDDVMEIARGYAENEHRAVSIVISWWLRECDLMLALPFEGPMH